MRRIRAEVDLMMTSRDVERLRQFAGTGAKAPNVFDTAPFSHQAKSSSRLDCADENESVAWPAFHEYVQHPVHAIVEINVGRARFIAPNELSRARAPESVTRFVAFDQIGLRLNDNADTLFPDQLRPDERSSAD
jgi:hypothetical protein